MTNPRSLLFIDTGAFYARYVGRDEYHGKSLQLWEKVKSDRLACLTTNFILSELITLFVYRFGVQQALQAGREIYNSHYIQIVSVTRDHELSALEWIEKYGDQKFSMADATSFAVMEEKGIKVAFSFDSHFKIAGFERF